MVEKTRLKRMCITCIARKSSFMRSWSYLASFRLKHKSKATFCFILVWMKLFLHRFDEDKTKKQEIFVKLHGSFLYKRTTNIASCYKKLSISVFIEPHTYMTKIYPGNFLQEFYFNHIDIPRIFLAIALGKRQSLLNFLKTFVPLGLVNKSLRCFSAKATRGSWFKPIFHKNFSYSI